MARVPPDNPFAKTPGALGMIWSLGNRNPQGLAWHPVTGELWSTEHGPRGGDELNVIAEGPQLRLADDHLRHQLRRHADHRQDRGAWSGVADHLLDALGGA